MSIDYREKADGDREGGNRKQNEMLQISGNRTHMDADMTSGPYCFGKMSLLF